MLDIKFVRENPEVVKENMRKKFQDEKLGLVDEVISLDVEARKVQMEADELRGKKNQVSKQIGALMAKGEKEAAEKAKAEVAIRGKGAGFTGRDPEENDGDSKHNRSIRTDWKR